LQKSSLRTISFQPLIRHVSDFIHYCLTTEGSFRHSGLLLLLSNTRSAGPHDSISLSQEVSYFLFQAAVAKLHFNSVYLVVSLSQEVSFFLFQSIVEPFFSPQSDHSSAQVFARLHFNSVVYLILFISNINYCQIQCICLFNLYFVPT